MRVATLEANAKLLAVAANEPFFKYARSTDAISGALPKFHVLFHNPVSPSRAAQTLRLDPTRRALCLSPDRAQPPPVVDIVFS